MLLLFFFNDPATTEIYTLSLHDALPICLPRRGAQVPDAVHLRQPDRAREPRARPCSSGDRKSTRLNSSHTVISYAVFCLKKKKTNTSYNDSEHPNHKATAISHPTNYLSG